MVWNAWAVCSSCLFFHGRLTPGASPRFTIRSGEWRGIVDTPYVEPTADVDRCAVLGGGTTVWHLAQIRENARLRSGCLVARGAYLVPALPIRTTPTPQNYAPTSQPAPL